ncbi:MAG: hypothetical protein ACR2IE_17955 [Candidatus Sumerlaeaceae bacterium]
MNDLSKQLHDFEQRQTALIETVAQRLDLLADDTRDLKRDVRSILQMEAGNTRDLVLLTHRVEAIEREVGIRPAQA